MTGCRVAEPIFYRDESGWHWKLDRSKSGEKFILVSDAFFTRRGALDDWNDIRNVIYRQGDAERDE